MNECDIFMAALDIDSPEMRGAYLDEACGKDTPLRRRVNTLLDSHAKSGSLLEHPAVGVADTQFLEDTEKLAKSRPDEERTVPGLDQIPLDFLGPSDQPESLGRLGQYDMREVVGRGGMGIVLKAHDTKLSRVVAVKVLAPELAANATARKRFLREARAAAAVSHDHVVTIYAVEENEPPKDSAHASRGGPPYLVMEFIDGQSLEQKIDRDGHLELKEILRIGRQVAAGLAAAHQQGLIHRDIKPSNILLQNSVERVQITDFGLARATDDVGITRTGEIAGTPQYMSPEQAQGKAVDARSDLFSLGSVLYAMCTGRSPFRAETTMASLKRVCDDTPRPLRQSNPELPEWLAAITDRLLEKDPDDRFQSAEEVCGLLGECLAHVQDPAVNPLPASLAGKGDTKWRTSSAKTTAATLRRSRWAVAAAVLIAVLALVTLSEATGVTNLAGTVIRIATGEGTLVIEVDDPTVQVSLDGEELSITGAGIQELKLRPGQYQFQAIKDGQPVKTELVSITRGDRQVVKVRLEYPAIKAPAIAAIAEPNAFVVLGYNGAEAAKFDTLAEAVLGSNGGDTIEIRGNGPFVTDPILIKRPLTIRAANGFRPMILGDPRTTPSFNKPLLLSTSLLVLEGVDLKHENVTGAVLLKSTGRICVANSRFSCQEQCGNVVWCSGNGRFRNCVVVANNAVTWVVRSEGRFAVENCVIVGKNHIHLFEDVADARLQLLGNTLVNPSPVHGILVPILSYVPQMELGTSSANPLRIAALSNAFDSPVAALQFIQDARLARHFDVVQAEAMLPGLLDWSDERNLFPAQSPLLDLRIIGKDLDTRRGQDFDDWNRFWGLTDSGSSQGVIRYAGGDLHTKAEFNPEQLTPEDFRLRPDSAGYRAGPDGKDLGADIDLVGPGEAYERWKQTPEYQEWQQQTRELMKAAAADQPAAEAVSGTETAEEPPATNSEEDQLPVEDSAEEQPATSDS